MVIMYCGTVRKKIPLKYWIMILYLVSMNWKACHQKDQEPRSGSGVNKSGSSIKKKRNCLPSNSKNNQQKRNNKSI
jgi:hypothetical protein